MTLTDSRLRELDNPDLTADQRASLRCRVASDLIHIGRYEAAREALGDLWRGVGVRPNVEGLEETTAAEVLLQCGSLSGWLGSAKQVSGAQDAAKDLLSEAVRIFERLGAQLRVATAQGELGVCYWREGALDEARVILLEAYRRLDDTDLEQKTRVLIRRTLTEISAGRYHDAQQILGEAEHIFKAASDALKGRWHGQMAVVLMGLGTAEGRADYLDRAIIEYTAAIYHYEQAGHERYKATNQNNLAFLLYRLGRYREAHEHLDRAGAVLRRLNDTGLMAQVDETRARVFLAEKKYGEADRVIKRAIQTLEKGGESALLADALTVQGVAWARLGAREESISILHRALDVAEGVGAHSNAGRAALTLIEEHGARPALSHGELYNLYRRADELLKNTQDAEDTARLRACARIGMRRLAVGELHDTDFSFYGLIHELEAKLIERALEETGGSVTRAAKLLGLRHQTLISILNNRHQNLLTKRTPPEKKLRSIIKEPKN